MVGWKWFYNCDTMLLISLPYVCDWLNVETVKVRGFENDDWWWLMNFLLLAVNACHRNWGDENAIKCVWVCVCVYCKWQYLHVITYIWHSFRGFIFKHHRGVIFNHKALGTQQAVTNPPIGELPSPNEPRKKPSYFPLYWLVNRDPYNGLL